MILYRWRVYDPIRKRRLVTRYRMTEEDARKTYGEDAERVDWDSLEVPDKDKDAWNTFTPFPKSDDSRKE